MGVSEQTTKVDHRAGFETLSDELTNDRAVIAGEIPPWLTGTLIRNGPARFEVEDQAFHHWFDGLAMLHAFSFADGEVSYSNRFLRSEAHRAAESGEISHRQFATDPCRSIFKRLTSSFDEPTGGNANVNLTRLGDRYLAMTETPIPVEFDPQTLATLGVADAPAPGQVTIAHPHQDPVSAELVSYAAHMGPRSSYKVYAQAPGGKPRVICSVPVRNPAYMHSFAITERYAVLSEWPLVVNPIGLGTSGLRGRPFIENYEWKPGRGTRYRVVDLREGVVRGTFEGEAMFSFHHVNAFERDGELVLDLVAYDDSAVIDALYLDRLRSDDSAVPRPELRRVTIDLDAGDVESAPLAAGFELPRINYAYNGREYGYAYGVDARPGGFLDTLQKVDLASGDVETWSEDGCFPGEPVYVPSPGASVEDDGVILSVVLDAPGGASFLLVLDASTFEERARARVPHRIPFGFHGQYFGDVA
jgi:carotenoid cleavage dioxygenase-like enzyme